MEPDTMAITMLKSNTKVSNLLGFYALLLLLSNQLSAQQQQTGLSAAASIDAELIRQSITAEGVDRIDSNSLRLTPQINLSYQGRTFSGVYTASVIHFERDNNGFSQESTFPQYNYSANWQAIDNILAFQANGNLTFINPIAGNFLLNDFVNDSGQLTRTRTNSISGALSIENNDFVTITGTSTFSLTESEQNEFTGNNALEGEFYSIT